MHSQCSRLTESFTTLVTLEWFFLEVDVLVIPQVILATECLLADVTAKRSMKEKNEPWLFLFVIFLRKTLFSESISLHATMQPSGLST